MCAGRAPRDGRPVWHGMAADVALPISTCRTALALVEWVPLLHFVVANVGDKMPVFRADFDEAFPCK